MIFRRVRPRWLRTAGVGAIASLLVSCTTSTDAGFELTMRSRVDAELLLCTDLIGQGTLVCAEVLEEQHFRTVDGGHVVVPAHTQLTVYRNRPRRGGVPCGGEEHTGRWLESGPDERPVLVFGIELDDGSSVSLTRDRQTLVWKGNFGFRQCVESSGTWLGTSGALRGRTGTYEWIYDSVQQTVRLEEDGAGSDDGSELGPSRESDQSGETTEYPLDDALATVDRYFEAAEAGDIEAMKAALAPGPSSSFIRIEPQYVRDEITGEARGRVLTDRNCHPGVVNTDSIAVLCTYGEHLYLEQQVGAPATLAYTTFIVANQRIVSALKGYSPPGWPASEAFDSWVRQQHVEVPGAVLVDPGGSSIEEIAAYAELHRQLVDQWAGYLAETGCAYDDVGC